MKTTLTNPYWPEGGHHAEINVSRDGENHFDIYFSGSHQSSTSTTFEGLVKLRDMLNAVIDEAKYGNKPV